MVLRLFVAATIGGALTGLVGGAFRLALEAASRARDALVAHAHTLESMGWLLPVAGAALAAGIARLLVRFAPLAGGSGIQYVEAIARGIVQPRLHALVIPVKFVGGVLSMGGGLALGREGPTVQMASRVGALLAWATRLAQEEARMLRTAMAGAGLGVAFNAPLGGVVFVFEELWRGFPVRLVACTLIAGAVSITVARLLLGNHADFPVGTVPLPPSLTLIPALLMGATLGLVGALYNKVTIESIVAFQAWRVPPELRAALVGALVGLVAWYWPSVVGSGENLVVTLLADAALMPVTGMLVLLALRSVLSPLSYATGAPGGLFAPMLVLGAFAGAIGIRLLDTLGLGFGMSPTGAVLVGMTAFFAAVVRSPVTGIALVTEMALNNTFLVPMLAACFAAVAVAELCGVKPIYDSLIERIPELQHELKP